MLLLIVIIIINYHEFTFIVFLDFSINKNALFIHQNYILHHSYLAADWSISIISSNNRPACILHSDCERIEILGENIKSI